MQAEEIEKIARLTAETVNAHLAPLFASLTKAVLSLRLEDQLSFSLRDASKITGVSYDSLYKLTRNGKLRYSQPTGKLGTILILREDLIDFISKRPELDESFEVPVGYQKEMPQGKSKPTKSKKARRGHGDKSKFLLPNSMKSTTN